MLNFGLYVSHIWPSRSKLFFICTLDLTSEDLTWIQTVRFKSTSQQDDSWATYPCLPFHSFLLRHSVRWCFHKQLWQVLLFAPPERQTTTASAGLLSGYRCTSARSEGQLPKRDNVTQGHTELICNTICGVSRSSGVKRVLCRSGRGWSPSSVCVLSIIWRTVLESWQKRWGTGCLEVLRHPSWTRGEGCPFMMWTIYKGRQRTMRKPRERNAAAQRARIKR